MSPNATPSLLEIEQAVEIKAREWQRQQLQKRLQQAADQQGAICPHSGQPLQAALDFRADNDFVGGDDSGKKDFPRARRHQKVKANREGNED